MGKLEILYKSVPQGKKKLRERISVVPGNTQGSDSMPHVEVQLCMNHPINLGTNGVKLTARQKYMKEYRQRCKASLKEYFKEYYKRNQERLDARNKKNRSRRKRKITEKQREYYREYYKRNKERIYENMKKLKEKSHGCRHVDRRREYNKEYYQRNQERSKEKIQAKEEQKNKGLKEADNGGESQALQKMDTSLLKTETTLSMAIPTNAHTQKKIPLKTPILKKCVVLLERLKIPASTESSQKSVPGVFKTPQTPKLPKTIPKKSTESHVSENRKNCILVESSERGNHVRELTVKSDRTYLQRIFLQVEKMLGA